MCSLDFANWNILIFNNCILLILFICEQALGKSPKQINTKAADMWSFAVLLWELSTREIPFPELTAMEAGMKIATEGKFTE